MHTQSETMEANRAQATYLNQMAVFWRDLIVANQTKLDDPNLDSVARALTLADLKFNREMLSAAEQDAATGKAALDAVPEFVDDEKTMLRPVLVHSAEPVREAVAEHARPELDTHLADVGDDANRALCGRVGLPIVSHAATCADCHDKMLQIVRLALGCTDQGTYLTRGGRRMYRYALPGILARFGFAMDLPPRVGEGAALEDVLRALRDGLSRMLGGGASVKYEEMQVPESYLCSKCKVSGLKLWRQWNTMVCYLELLCAACAAPGVQVDQDGRHDSEHGGGSDQLSDVGGSGSLAPAVPTTDGESYWGYTSVPLAGCAWWRALPTYAGQPQRPFYIDPKDAAAEAKMLADREAYQKQSSDNRKQWRKETVYCVEASDCEHQFLWERWSAESMTAGIVDKDNRLSWEQMHSGELATINPGEERPICVSVRWARLNGKVVMFYWPTSELVDWKRIKEWLATEYAHVKSHGDAENFGNCLRKVRP